MDMEQTLADFFLSQIRQKLVRKKLADVSEAAARAQADMAAVAAITAAGPSLYRFPPDAQHPMS
jgi:hypothetical protein